MVRPELAAAVSRCRVVLRRVGFAGVDVPGMARGARRVVLVAAAGRLGGGGFAHGYLPMSRMPRTAPCRALALQVACLGGGGHAACSPAHGGPFFGLPYSHPKEPSMNLSKIRLSLTLIPAAALGLSALALPAAAQTASGASSAVRSNEQIDNQYKMDKKQCDAMKGNQKDVCEQQAQATRDKARADAKAGKEKAEANHDAAKARNEADYKVGKENAMRCPAMPRTPAWPT
ncbi:hypothetical protein WJ977_23915 [Achromobacter xylosoxidans]